MWAASAADQSAGPTESSVVRAPAWRAAWGGTPAVAYGPPNSPLKRINK